MTVRELHFVSTEIDGGVIFATVPYSSPPNAWWGSKTQQTVWLFHTQIHITSPVVCKGSICVPNMCGLRANFFRQWLSCLLEFINFTATLNKTFKGYNNLIRLFISAKSQVTKRPSARNVPRHLAFPLFLLQLIVILVYWTINYALSEFSLQRRLRHGLWSPHGCRDNI